MIYFVEPPGDGSPSVHLKFWSIRELDDGTRHLIGRSEEFRELRVSTAIVELDARTRQAKTASGRRYVLVGPSGTNGPAENFWLTIVKQLGDNRTWRDVTLDLVPGSDERSDAPP